MIKAHPLLPIGLLSTILAGTADYAWDFDAVEIKLHSVAGQV